MVAVFGVLSLIGVVVGIILIIVFAITKQKLLVPIIVASCWLVIFVICMLISRGSSKEDTTKEEIESTNNVQIEDTKGDIQDYKTSNNQVIYEYNDKINKFCNYYNEHTTGEKITSDKIHQYTTLRGKVLNDQAEFYENGTQVIVRPTNDNNIELLIYGGANQNVNDYKKNILTVLKTLDSSITADEVETMFAKYGDIKVGNLDVNHTQGVTVKCSFDIISK